MRYQEVIRFWFEEIEPKQWYAKDPEFDSTIQRRFGAMHASATRCELASWRATPQGRLAEIILLDQFSRNIYRDTPWAFAWDALALCLTQQAIEVGADLLLESIPRAFMYSPMMHSESILIHEQAVRFFSQSGLENSLRYEQRHRAIIERFGRYPHRNAVLGRVSTDEELAFLLEPGSTF